MILVLISSTVARRIALLKGPADKRSQHVTKSVVNFRN